MTWTPDGWGIGYDFDKTLLSVELYSLIQMIDVHALDEAGLAEKNAMRAEYASEKYRAGLPLAAQREWLRKTIAAHVRGGLTRLKWQEALREAKLRPGVVEAVTHLHALGVKQSIISFGYAEPIEYVLELHGIRDKIERVYATRLIHDESGSLTGHHPHTEVLQATKCAASHAFLHDEGVRPDRMIGVGDSPGDNLIGFRRELRFGIAETDDNVAQLQAHGRMSHIFKTRDFTPVFHHILDTMGAPYP